MARAWLLAASFVVLALGVRAQSPCAGNSAVCATMDASVCDPSTKKFNYPNISGVTPACAYTPVAPNMWTMTADPTDEKSFPLGFRQGMFGEDNNPAFGVRVKAVDVYGKKVELMIETLQAGAIVCARGATPNPLNMANSRLVNQCATQRLYACFNGPIDPNMDLDLLIYCNSGCRSADTDFWYRITTSTSTWQNPTDANGMDVEMWCDMQMALNTTIFPSQLAPAAPAGFKVADTSAASTYAPNAAVSVRAFAASALAAVGAAAMAVLLV